MAPSFDPGSVFQEAKSQATTGVSTAALFMLAILAGVGLLVWNAGRK